MSELKEKLEEIIDHPLEKIILSNGTKDQFKKIVLTRENDNYAAEKFTEKQVFHERISVGQLGCFCESCMDNGFRQLNAFSNGEEFSLKLSKKGKVLAGTSKNRNKVKTKSVDSHKKNYYLQENEVIPPLVDMGVFTKEGKVASNMHDKYRQINKFIQFIDEAVDKSGLKTLNIIDFGCGKSYLTFVVYYYLTYIKGLDVTMTGMDLKEDVIRKCQQTAEKYGYDKLNFLVGNIADYVSDRPVDMVITLHACDVATDYALFHAIQWKTSMIISVPCCQHELNGQMESETFKFLTRYGLVKERIAALMTDAIRANLLEYCGYKTQLLEFIDFSHTPKNIMIRAVKANISEKHRGQMLQEVKNLMEEYHLEPTLYRMLVEAGDINSKSIMMYD